MWLQKIPYPRLNFLLLYLQYLKVCLRHCKSSLMSMGGGGRMARQKGGRERAKEEEREEGRKEGRRNKLPLDKFNTQGDSCFYTVAPHSLCA